MSDNNEDTLFILAASYATVAEADADYEAVKEIYAEIHTSHDFDATVIEKRADGKVRVVKKHEQPTRHGAATGLVFGLAVGAITAVFPAIALVDALIVGGGAGAAIGALRGHITGGLDNDDLKALGEVLDVGTAGLLVVYAANLEDQIAQAVTAVDKAISKEIDLDADQLAKDLEAADAADAASPSVA